MDIWIVSFSTECNYVSIHAQTCFYFPWVFWVYTKYWFAGLLETLFLVSWKYN